jgi:hypothetical protein
MVWRDASGNESELAKLYITFLVEDLLKYFLTDHWHLWDIQVG